MAEELPPNEFYEYFGPDYSLSIRSRPDVENKNKAADLDKVVVGAGYLSVTVTVTVTAFRV